MERREHQVAGLGRGQRDLDRLAIAHLADEDHLRRLAQRGAQRQREARRVGVQLALVNRALLVRVQELDRILDGEDVLGARLVDQIDDGGERGRLARAGRAGDQHDAGLQRGDIGERRRQLQLGDGRDRRRDDAHDDRERAALPEDVDAEPARDGSEYEKSVAPSFFSARSACALPPIRSRAIARGVGGRQHIESRQRAPAAVRRAARPGAGGRERRSDR